MQEIKKKNPIRMVLTHLKADTEQIKKKKNICNLDKNHLQLDFNTNFKPALDVFK